MRRLWLVLRLWSAVAAVLLMGGHQTWAGTTAEIADFGSNPGQLKMFRYIPDGLRGPAPLVVVLHGCGQTAASFAQAAGWTKQADRWGFALLLPEQQAANNSGLCFNWFEPEDTERDRGEAQSIRQMIDRMQSEHPVDPQKMYVAGLSAGGAMTAALLAAYPDVFAGGAVVAGIPYGCANSLMSGLWCMQFSRDLKPKRWAKFARKATHDLRPPVARWPRVSIWQGEGDSVVNPENAQELLEQWTEVSGADQTADGEERVKGFPRHIYKDPDGRVVVETYTLSDVGHGIPVAPGEAEDACGVPADYVLAIGICASYHIGQFWGLGN